MTSSDDGVLRLEALSQSLGFVANSMDEVSVLLKGTSPEERVRLKGEIETLRRAVARLDRETVVGSDED